MALENRMPLVYVEEKGRVTEEPGFSPVVWDNSGSIGDPVSLVMILFDVGVRHTDNQGRHPADGFLYASSKVLQSHDVVQIWKPFWTNDSI
jgi:hypothetical protein